MKRKEQQKHFSPYIRVARHDLQNMPFRFDRVIWDYEIIYVQSGTIKLTVENQIYECNQGDFIFLKPRIHHILESGSDIVLQPHIHFDFFEDELSSRIFVAFVTENFMSSAQKKWFRQDITKEYDLNFPPRIIVANPLVIKDILFELIDEHNYKKPYHKILEHALFLKLISELARQYQQASTVSKYEKHIEKFNQLIAYINENVDINLSLDDLAKFCNISPFYLSRIFKSLYGMSPHKYISQIRLNHAKHLIQFTTLSIKEIAYKMNFNEQETFTRWFKSLDGFTPTQYRINKKISKSQ